ncbi:[Protein-PII] uridylyltransferase / [Protein-PII]-UMP uridylyl-removing enzyme [hydrothermal vent metagenome]|uniref:[Protein-PII] uridylyltransferase / [Protein-PII]-UMP uridylyl-removing enzyme n=1 Tax=hydrothermal vent metagenome TaxID=652676 RepID=A0A3B1CZI6_9ZZZZ
MTPGKTESLRKSLEAKRALIKERHDKGMDGLQVCDALCRIVDDVIKELFTSGEIKFNGALVAIGGYGRGLLNPFSDIDLLYLLKKPGGGGDADGPKSILGILWDLKLKVGHSTRTIADTVEIGLSDITARTAMIESRFIEGDKNLFDEYKKKYESKVIRYRPNVFINMKTDEMTLRRKAHGGALLLTEPNLKESRGALRDLHTAWWVIRSKLDISSFKDIVRTGATNMERVERVAKAHSFILRIRNALHWRLEKPEDVLVQSVQAAIGRSEGLAGADNIVAAQLMREYYMAAEVIDEFTTEMVDFALNYKRRRFWRPIYADSDGLFTDGEKLHAKSFPPSSFEETPQILFRIARKLSDENLKPAPNLWRGLRKLCRSAPDEWFVGNEAGKLLIEILKLRNSARPISVFSRTGLLERLIPEFREIRKLSQFDMFHKFSVDEHTIATIRNLENIPDAQVGGQLRSIFRSQPDLEIVKLALIMHDLGKRAEDHHAEENPDDRTHKILNRLGLEEYFNKVGFLVREHLLMSITAQRHDFADPETLKHFCRITNDRKNLRRLYLLTYADIAAVGPGVWTAWKDKLLDELFDQARLYYIEKDAMFLSHDKRLKALAGAVAREAQPKMEIEEALSFLGKAPPRYLRNATPEIVASDIRLVNNIEEKRIVFQYTPNPGDLSGKITLAASERLGFFSLIAGAFAAKNVNIIEAHIHTFGIIALDYIIVGGANLSMFSDSHSLARFTKEIIDILDGKKDIKEMVKRRTKYLQKNLVEETIVEPKAKILNHLSEESTVLEIWAQDRIGLLYDITRTIARLELNIKSAKISAEGATAIDVFYVRTMTGGKVEDPARAQEIIDAILSAISSPAGID